VSTTDRFRFDVGRLATRPTGAFALEREVRLQDVDAAGIVFFARLLEYSSDVFVAFCAAHDINLAEVLREKRWGAPVRHLEAHYLRPLVFGDRVEVALVGAHLEEKQATLGYRVARLADGTVTTLVQVLHVFVDAVAYTRRPVPDELRLALCAWCDPEHA
jgi:YbgC/YbaW family acyl-CoA thioester hydrolase